MRVLNVNAILSSAQPAGRLANAIHVSRIHVRETVTKFHKNCRPSDGNHFSSTNSNALGSYELAVGL